MSPKRERTRQELLEAARRVVSRKGLLAATTSDIANEAGRAPATIYLYFPSMLDLAYELAREFDSAATQPGPSLRAEPGDDVQSPSGSTREVIRHAVEQFWTTFAEQLAVAVGALQLAMVERTFNAEWAEIRHTVTQRFARSIRRLQDCGESPAFDPVPVASALGVTMFHMAIVAHYFGEGADDPATGEHAIDVLTEIWYRAVTTPFG